jgi:exonuclease III
VKSVQISIVSANVNSLIPAQDDRSYSRVSCVIMSSKVQVLELEFNSYEAEIICVQEGRARETAEKSGLYYAMFIAPASSTGSYGVQVWIRKCLSPKCASWKVFSPRLAVFVGVLHSNTVPVAIVSGHSPCEHAKPKDKFEFWELWLRCIDYVTTKFPSHTIIVGIDANSRVGSVQSPCIGNVDPDVENDNGSLFRQHIQASDLRAVNTWHPVGRTWTSS